MATGQVVLITGCSSGIGRSAAAALLTRGHTVYATARRAESVDELREAFASFGDRTRVRRLDVTEPATSEEVLADITSREGRLDALVNNAAFGQIGAVEELTADQLRRQYEVNVIGICELTRRVIPEMRRAGKGRIINVSSVVAHVSTPLMGAYNSSQAALTALTESLRMEMVGTGIDTILIEPGVIATSFRDNAMKTRDDLAAEASSRYQAVHAAWLDRWRKRLAGGVTPASAVADSIVHAIESPRPRTRYRITAAARFAPFVFALLPDRIADRILLRAFRLTGARRP